MKGYKVRPLCLVLSIMAFTTAKSGWSQDVEYMEPELSEYNYAPTKDVEAKFILSFGPQIQVSNDYKNVYNEGKDFTSIAIRFTQGVHIGPYFFIGIGAGLNYYYEELSMGIPVFGALNFTFTTDRIAPFAGGDIGKAFELGDFNDLSGFVHPRAGVRVKGLKD